MPNSTESAVWSGTPSQWLNFGAFIVCGMLVVVFVAGASVWSQPWIAAAAVVPIAVVFWKWLRVKTTKIEVTTERITTQVGVFSRHRWDMELYRVKDTTLHEPFLLRIVHLANIELASSDRTTPSMTLPAIRDAEALRQKIRANVERLRAIRGVREMDMDVER